MESASDDAGGDGGSDPETTSEEGSCASRVSGSGNFAAG